MFTEWILDRDNSEEKREWAKYCVTYFVSVLARGLPLTIPKLPNVGLSSGDSVVLLPSEYRNPSNEDATVDAPTPPAANGPRWRGNSAGCFRNLAEADSRSTTRSRERFFPLINTASSSDKLGTVLLSVAVEARSYADTFSSQQWRSSGVKVLRDRAWPRSDVTRKMTFRARQSCSSSWSRSVSSSNVVWVFSSSSSSSSTTARTMQPGRSAAGLCWVISVSIRHLMKEEFAYSTGQWHDQCSGKKYFEILLRKKS